MKYLAPVIIIIFILSCISTDVKTDELATRQLEMESLENELDVAQQQINDLHNVLSEAKTKFEIFNFIFSVIFVLDDMNEEILEERFVEIIDSTGDPVLKNKIEAVMDSDDDEQMFDFFSYLCANITDILERVQLPSLELAEAPGSARQPADPDQSGFVIEWEDPASGREAVTMVLPRIPQWVSEQGLQLKVVVAFVLTPQGILSSVHLEESSGYSDVDSAVLDAVRKWKFKAVRSNRLVRGRLPYRIISN
ncbi:hypothetical protein ES705_39113 [subsurface metagenome]